MQQMPTPIHRPDIRNAQLDMSKMQNKTSQRHKHSKKHPKRREKNNRKKFKH